MARRLPTFRGYTVDLRLREFRKLAYGQQPEFIPFASEQGSKLLDDWSTECEKSFLREVGYWLRTNSEIVRAALS